MLFFQLHNLSFSFILLEIGGVCCDNSLSYSLKLLHLRFSKVFFKAYVEGGGGAIVITKKGIIQSVYT